MRPFAVLPDRASLMRAAADRIVILAEGAIRERGRFAWALAGGNTPRALYSLLASPEYVGRIDWSRVHFFWGDERCVPPSHPESNYHMANETLLGVVQPPAEHVHRMQAELNPSEAATRYELELAEALGGERLGHFGRFDLVLLGMGSDGHTASLFPGSPALAEKERAVVATTAFAGGEAGAPASGAFHRMGAAPLLRLSLTLSMLNAARSVMFLVAGSDKAERLAEVLVGPHPGPPFPVELVRPERAAEWFVDAAAGAKVEGSA